MIRSATLLLLVVLFTTTLASSNRHQDVGMEGVESGNGFGIYVKAPEEVLRLHHYGYNRENAIGVEDNALEGKDDDDGPDFKPRIVPYASFGNYDYRYYDWVVEPRLDCSSEGYFPHPRNCSWYIRCTDPWQIGYFYTTYYECAPGTVFDDQLDVCVWPSSVDACPQESNTLVPYGCNINNEGTCSNAYVCPDQTTNFQRSYYNRICIGTTYTCVSGGQFDLCPTGSLYDATDNTCIREDTLCRNRPQSTVGGSSYSVVCQDVFENCFDYEQCATYSRLFALGYSKRLCSYKRQCTYNNNINFELDMCPSGFYDINNERCLNALRPEICPLEQFITFACQTQAYNCYGTYSCQTMEPVYHCQYYCYFTFRSRSQGTDCEAQGAYYDQEDDSCKQRISQNRESTRESTCINTGNYISGPDSTTPATTAATTPTPSCLESQIGEVLDIEGDDYDFLGCRPLYKCATNGDFLYEETYCPRYRTCINGTSTNASPTAIVTSCQEPGSELFLRYKKCTTPPEQEECNAESLPSNTFF